MRLMLLLAALGCGMSCPAYSPAQPYRPAFQPGELKSLPGADRNEVMIVASPVLQSFVGVVTITDPVVDRLANWVPTQVATEDVSGVQCAMLRQQVDRYKSAIEQHCFDTADARADTGFDVLAANAETERLLGEWPQSPTPAQRRRLAALFLAAGEPVSAVVQWLRLPKQERKAGNGLTTRLARELKSRATRKDESYMVGAVLATRLELEHVHSIGDQSAAREMAHQLAFDMAIADLRNNPARGAKMEQEEPLLGNMSGETGLLDLYRHYNAADYPKSEYDSEFGPALADRSKEAVGQLHLARWETQNLRMASHIRDALAGSDGTRLMVIVRARHKGYLEAYLQQMHDVHLVDPLSVLKQ